MWYFSESYTEKLYILLETLFFVHWFVALLRCRWVRWKRYPLMSALKPQSNGSLWSNTVIGSLAGDGWAVTYGTVRRCLGAILNIWKVLYLVTWLSSSALHTKCWHGRNIIMTDSGTVEQTGTMGQGEVVIPANYSLRTVRANACVHWRELI